MTDSPTSHTTVNLPADLAARFTDVYDLASGGEARVVTARDIKDGQRRVIKLYNPGIVLPPIPAKLAEADPRYVLRVERGKSPGPDAADLHWEIMDYLPHGSLDGHLKSTGRPMPEPKVRQLVTQLTDRLHYIHTELKMAHRDVKPANILLWDDPTRRLDIVLADLGLATEINSAQPTARHSVKGTLHYQAPETLFMRNAEPPRDWWALGIVVIEVLAGQHPFTDNTGEPFLDAYIFEALRTDSLARDLVADPRWRLLVEGLTTKNPDDRWKAEQVRAWLEGQSPPVTISSAVSEHGPLKAASKITFDHRQYDDPAKLATAFVDNWNAATEYFADTDSRTELGAWINEDVRDLAFPNPRRIFGRKVIGDPDGQDIAERILIFHRHYCPNAPPTWRGKRADAESLSRMYSQAAVDDRSPQAARISSLAAGAMAELAQYPCTRHAGCGQTGCQVIDRYRKNLPEIDQLSSQLGIRLNAEVTNDATKRALPQALTNSRYLTAAALLNQPMAQQLTEKTARNRQDVTLDENKNWPAWHTRLDTTSASGSEDQIERTIVMTLALSTFSLAHDEARHETERQKEAEAEQAIRATQHARDEKLRVERERKAAASTLRRRVGIRTIWFGLYGLSVAGTAIYLRTDNPIDPWSNDDHGVQASIVMAVVGTLVALALLAIHGFISGLPRQGPVRNLLRFIGFLAPIGIIVAGYQLADQPPNVAFIQFVTFIPVLTEILAAAIAPERPIDSSGKKLPRPGSAPVPRILTVIVALFLLLGLVGLSGGLGVNDLIEYDLNEWSLFVDNTSLQLWDWTSQKLFTWVNDFTPASTPAS